jgi:hypothetical protein
VRTDLKLEGNDVYRFWKKVNFHDPYGCHLWTASLDGHGYGQFSLGGRPRKAHQIAWVAKHEEMPEGLELDHTCRRPACVNTDHLEPVTHQENIERAFKVRPFLCGHPKTPENTYVRPSTGHRRCRTCKSAQEKAARRRV